MRVKDGTYHGGWRGMIEDVIDRAEGAAMEVYNLEEKIRKKLDDRLFPNDLLYCEGMPRPAFRGMLHLYCAVLLPFGFWHLCFIEANGNSVAQFAAGAYLFGQLFCCFISAMYHVGKWSPSTEIFLQKLDHCGIAVCSSGINFPSAFLLLPGWQGYSLALLSTVTCAWTCWNVTQKRPGVWRLVVNASVIVLYMPLLFGYYMTYMETFFVLSNTVAQLIGTIIFTRKSPDPWPDVFGYHEVFHVFTVIGFLSVYLVHWSVVHRTCNPYAYRLNVLEILWGAILQTFVGGDGGPVHLRGGG